jgi:archaellum component FlaF (FlaF/FlaG flagellin family)
LAWQFDRDGSKVVGRSVTVNLSNGSYVSTFGSVEKFVINPGDTCVIKPVNPNKKKHRDRQCIVTGKAKECSIQVRFLDTGRHGYVDPEDLVPVSHASTDK